MSIYTEYEHSSGAGNGSVQSPHGHSSLLPVQHPQGHQRSRGDVTGARGGCRLHAEGQDSRPVDEEVLPVTEASWFLRQRLAGKIEVLARLVLARPAYCFLDIWLLLHPGFPHRYCTKTLISANPIIQGQPVV